MRIPTTCGSARWTSGKGPRCNCDGRPECLPRDLVPVAKHNSTLPGDIHIKKGKLRGEVSDGMLCSYKELGMTDNDWPYSIVDGSSCWSLIQTSSPKT